MWTSLQSLIPKAAGKYNIAKTLKAIEVCQEYRSLAPRIVHADSLKNTFPKSYDNNTLTIGATSSAWAQKIQMSAHVVQQELAKKYGQNAVTKIRVVLVPNLPDSTPVPPVSPAET